MGIIGNANVGEQVAGPGVVEDLGRAAAAARDRIIY
jgi:hypothetical protein